MDIIMNHIADTVATDVVILYGQAGFGKSTIALHVGHKMLERGVDVHYIRVEDYADVASLEQVLMSISGATYDDMKLMRWAKSLRKRTLLILDNVDGHNWIKKKTFQSQFVDELLSHSKLLQLLITSQEELWSAYNIHSYQLTSLSLDNCVLLVNHMTAEHQNPSQSKEFCSLVGNVPMAIKVLTAIPNYSLGYVIERLNVTMPSKKLEFVASAGERVDKDRLISAIELGFEFVEPQHQICSLLLVTLPGPFTHYSVRIAVTSYLIENLGFQDFYMKDCLVSLTSKSFLQQLDSYYMAVYGDSLHVGLYRPYHFHELIKDFLNIPIVLGRYNTTELRTTFWKNYLNWVSNKEVEYSISEYSQLAHILDHDHMYDFATALLITTILSFKELLGQGTLELAVNALLSDCETAGLKHFVSRPSQVINAYVVIYERIKDSYKQLRVTEKSLILCQQKVELLVAAAKSEYDLQEAVNASAHFHYNVIGRQCLTYSLCRNSSWKYLLMGVTQRLVFLQNSSIHPWEAEGVKCSNLHLRGQNSSTITGMELFAVKEDAVAISYLHMALQDSNTYSCKELHDAIVYITLYVIHERQGDQQGMKESIAGILDIDFQHSNMAWYYYDDEYVSYMYSEIIFPFLTQVTNISMRSHGIETDIAMQHYLESPSPWRNCPIDLFCFK